MIFLNLMAVVLRGDKFMKEHANEMADMVDKAERMKAQMINDDSFIARENGYEVKLNQSEANIANQINKLEEHYKTEISLEKLPEMLEKYNYENNVDFGTRVIEQKSLQESLEQFQNLQNILQEIDQRKQHITQEVDKHIDGINEYRKKAGVHENEIKQKTSQVGIRSKRTIEDLRKK